jgi:hypothetical protein
MARSKFDEDAPLYSASTGSKCKVKKQTDLKPTAMKKVSAPKTDKAGGAKSSGGKMQKVAKPSKISAPKAKNYVRPQVRTEKARAEFSLPKLGMRKSKVGGRKR